jgi:hypothetical protein
MFLRLSAGNFFSWGAYGRKFCSPSAPEFVLPAFVRISFSDEYSSLIPGFYSAVLFSSGAKRRKIF